MKILKIKQYRKHVTTQLAFGIGSIDANLDLFNMAAYAKEKGIIPNITINGDRMTPAYYDALVKHMGAVAVSRYNPDTCYNAVHELTQRGMEQCNIHMLLSADTLNECYKVIDDSFTDYRLAKLNAIVFLLLKPKGRGTKRNQLKNFLEYKELIDYALERKARIGMDSCSASNFMRAIYLSQDYEALAPMVESCESTLMSSYVNAEGKFFPCSFAENTEGWTEGLDVANCNNFLEDIWLHPKTQEFRDKLFKSQENNKHDCRECPIYSLEMK